MGIFKQTCSPIGSPLLSAFSGGGRDRLNGSGLTFITGLCAIGRKKCGARVKAKRQLNLRKIYLSGRVRAERLAPANFRKMATRVSVSPTCGWSFLLIPQCSLAAAVICRRQIACALSAWARPNGGSTDCYSQTRWRWFSADMYDLSFGLLSSCGCPSPQSQPHPCPHAAFVSPQAPAFA